MSRRFNPITRCRRARWLPALGCVAAVLALVMSGCAGDAAVAPSPSVNDPQMYWALALDHHAVTLSTVAPYDTIRLTATPRTVDGTPLADLPVPTFTSLDLDRALVSAEGLVRVIKSGSQIPVVATLTVGNLRHADTVLINVTDVATPPVLAALSIHPDSGDSAKTATGASKSIVARARTADDTVIAGLSVYYASLDPTVATIDRATGFLQPVRPGHVNVVATATAYGVTKADTLPFTIGYPVTGLFINITAQRTASGQTVGGFSPARLVIGPGGTVLILNSSGMVTDMTFADPTNVMQADLYCGPPWTFIWPYACGSGNVEAFAREPGDQFGGTAVRARSFPVPGTYTYHSTIFGTTGTIVVVDESTSIP
jgi:hypothetical protein